MESPSNRGDATSTRHFPPLNETCSVRDRSQLFELLAKGAPWKPPNESDYCQRDWVLSTNGRQDPIAKDNIYISH